MQLQRQFTLLQVRTRRIPREAIEQVSSQALTWKNFELSCERGGGEGG